MKIEVIDGECAFFRETLRIGPVKEFSKARPFSGDVKNVLVLQQGRLGDLCMTLPLLECIRALYPQVHITLIVNEDMRAVAASFPYVTEVIGMCAPRDFNNVHVMSHPLQRVLSAISLVSCAGYGTMIRRLRTRKYDIGIDVLSRRRNRALLWMLGVRARAGFWLRGDRFTSHPASWTYDNVALQNLALLETIIGRKAGYIHHAHDLLRSVTHKVDIAMHLSSGGESSRRWHESRWATLVDDLSQDFKVQVICSSAERDVMDSVKRKAKHAQYVVVNDFKTLAGNLASARLVIGVDGGPLHVADMLGVPVLGLFSREDPRTWGFLTKGSSVTKGIRGVCSRRDCGWSACIDSLRADDVARRARAMLRGTA